MIRGLPLALSAGAVIVIAVVSWQLLSDSRDDATTRDSHQAAAGRVPEPASDGLSTDSPEAGPLPVDASSSHADVEPTMAKSASRIGQPTPTASAHFAGQAQDDVGVPLVGHAIEVYAVSPSGLEFGDLQARAVTNGEGRFWIDSVDTGPKRVVICGPGDGDIWDKQPDIHGYHAQREERELLLGIPGSGLDDFVLRGVDHTGILVTARVVDELGRPVQSWDFVMADANHRGGSLMNLEGKLSGIVPVGADGDYELRRGHKKYRAESDPLHGANYVPLKVHLTRTSDRIDLGTLVVTRMAGLKLSMVDGTNGSGLGDADVRLHVTGGGQPPADPLCEANKDGSYDLWSGRSSGQYELDVTATGYQPVHRVGVLVAGDALVPLELTLEPK